jgi:tetratricopeptide (TPR) repeat protein
MTSRIPRHETETDCKPTIVLRERVAAMEMSSEVSSRSSALAVLRLSFARALIRVIICLLLLPCCVLPGAAQSLDDAIAAYQRKDFKKALSLFEAIGAQGSAVAQHNAGHMYVNGLGTKRNFPKAMAWYRRAADQGYAPSQYDLGAMYAEGEGVKPDPEIALMWFRKSAEQGFVRAEVKLAEIAFASRNLAEAFVWWQKAADGGDADAMFNVGSAYYAGRGVAKDLDKAIQYYRKARDAGNPDAGRILQQLGADCMKVGEIVTAEGEVAERTFRSAAGKPLRAFVLTLPVPACMRGEDIEGVDGVRTIELRTSNRALSQTMQRLRGKKLLVRGTASAGLTAWFYSPIVIEISEIEPR